MQRQHWTGNTVQVTDAKAVTSAEALWGGERVENCKAVADGNCETSLVRW